MRTINIELRFDLDNPTVGDPIALKVALQSAQNMYAAIALISGKRKPQIAFTTGNMFTPNESFPVDGDVDELVAQIIKGDGE